MIKVIVAMSSNRVIGIDGDLPWNIPEDMKRVSNLTRGNFVLMGRKTYFSIPDKFRPLPGRTSIVLTRSDALDVPDEVHVVSDIPSALACYKEHASEEQSLWIFGGGQIYASTIDMWEEVYVTRVDQEVEGDTSFPEFEENFKEVSREDFSGFSFLKYVRKV